MNNKLWLIPLLVFVFLAAACGPAAPDRQTSIAVDTVIVYEREGGIAGISQEWVIHLDGTIDAPGDQHLSVPPEEVMEVVETGVDSEIATLAPDLATPDTCCDQFTYTITVISGDNQWSLITTDTADQPQEVIELFQMVEQLLAEAEPLR